MIGVVESVDIVKDRGDALVYIFLPTCSLSFVLATVIVISLLVTKHVNIGVIDFVSLVDNTYTDLELLTTWNDVKMPIAFFRCGFFATSTVSVAILLLATKLVGIIVESILPSSSSSPLLDTLESDQNIAGSFYGI